MAAQCMYSICFPNMSCGGAQVEQVGHPFFVFRDRSSKQVRVLYKRKTRGYGVIVPQLDD